MLNEAEKLEILKSYRWIKVPGFADDPSLSWEERFRALEKHHVQETTFLIEKIRQVITDTGNV